MSILFTNTSEGRSKLLTLLLVVIIPLPFLFLFVPLFIRSLQRGIVELDHALGSVGLIIFILLWSKQVINDTYCKPIDSKFKFYMNQISAWSLIFALVMVTDIIIKGAIHNFGFVINNDMVFSVIMYLITYVGWRLGGILKNLGETPLTKYKKRKKSEIILITPRAILEQAILGVFGYMMIALLMYFIAFY